MDGGKQGSFWRGTHWNGVPEPLCDYWQQSYCIASSQVEFKGGEANQSFNKYNQKYG